MKERPILFSAPMVRAVLEDCKTQTRRIINPQPDIDHGWEAEPGQPEWALVWKNGEGHTPQELAKLAPYGKPGDRLWVRETWAARPGQDRLKPTECDDSGLWWRASLPTYPEGYAACHGKWRPSIHMPRWASRINLEITRVRVERLQDITDADAQAEGAVFTDFGKDRWGNQHPGWTMEPPVADQVHCLGGPRWAFANLINKINGPKTWDANPWVWVVDFRRLP